MSSYSEGQIHQLANALEAKGFTPDHLRKLGQSTDLLLLRDFLDGKNEIRPMDYTIDLDAKPFLPVGWDVEHHQNGGKFKYDPTKVKLYLSECQRSGCGSNGNDLLKELEDQKVMNANFLDFYLKYPHLVPENWKGKSIFFWGTRYLDPLGDKHVLSMYWLGQRWNQKFNWINGMFGARSPAVILMS